MKKGLMGMALVDAYAIVILITILFVFYFFIGIQIKEHKKEIINAEVINDLDLVLLNYLRTPINNDTIADLIVKGENIEKETKEIFDQLGFECWQINFKDKKIGECKGVNVRYIIPDLDGDIEIELIIKKEKESFLERFK